MPQPRVRMAPSPTGFLHVGTAHTALFNYLFAKREGGIFVLRIEDTDLERSDVRFEKDIFDELAWLGIEADESPVKGGTYGPYRQSERAATYRPHIERLLRQGHAFYCFHTQDELEAEKKNLLHEKRPPIHLCEFRAMDPKEADMLKDAKPNYVIRFKTPAGKRVAFHDVIRGALEFSTDILGDFSIARRVDVPLFHFAVVVDDYEMKITHVIRGEDHIPNTPKHILLNEALGFPQPLYAHLSLLLGPDRSKLSKRHGATAVAEFRELGYLPEALINFLGLLGWNPGNDRELFSRDELAQEFSLEGIQKSGAIFDFQKLDWMNGEYIRKKSPTTLTDLCVPYIEKSLGITIENMPRSFLEAVISLEQPRLKKLSDIGEKVSYFFSAPVYEKELLRWKNQTNQEIKDALARADNVLANISADASQSAIETAFFSAIGEGDKGALLWPLRVALTGRKASPGPFEIIAIMGRDEARNRLARAQILLQ